MNFVLRLTINTSAALFVLKLWFFFISHNHKRSIYFISFIQDVFLFIAIYFLFIYIFRKFIKLQVAGRVLFFAFYLIFTVISFIYTFFLFDLLSFPVNIFGISFKTAIFFINYFLNASLIIALIGGISILFGISWFFPKKIGWNKLPVVAAIILCLLFSLTIMKGAINPIAYSVKEQITLSFAKNSYISKLKQPTPIGQLENSFKFLNKSFKTIPQIKSKYKRIIVFVMEGVNYKDYWTKSNADKKSFPNKYKQNILSFDNYHTLNLDSYTSLIAMLNNIFIPYQAYVNEKKYHFINKKNNIIRCLNANGFNTHFLTSYGEQQKRFVPNIKEWTQVTCMKNIENLTQYAKVTANKVEMAAEDLAVFDNMVQILKNTSPCFIFQEMVYGHTSSWKEQTGIATIDYYNQYFTKTIEALKSNKLDDNTLVIMVSDHGPRKDAYTTKNYHIPMLVWANDLQEGINTNFTSHLDFKNILIGLMTGNKFVLQQDTIFTLGNSGELIYGQITADNKYVFINNRMSNLKSNLDEKSIKEFSQLFQNYLNYFESIRLGVE